MTKWLGLFVLLVIFAPQSDAQRSRVGNGGARLESVFRRQAYQLISDIGNRPAADAVCAAVVMKEALEGAEIDVVDTLIDKATGLPPEKPNLEAWTVPGHIQLLKEPWTRYMANQSSIDEGVRILIAHEIYRATKICDDNTGQISQKLPDLLRQPTRNSIIYRFDWFGRIPITSDESGLWMDREWVMDPKAVSDYRFSSVACDTNLDFSKTTRTFVAPPNKEATCVGIEQTGILVVFKFTSFRVYDKTSAVFWPWSLQVESRVLQASEKVAIENSLRFASKDRPLFVVYDLDENGMAYGFGLSRLNKIQ